MWHHLYTWERVLGELYLAYHLEVGTRNTFYTLLNGRNPKHTAPQGPLPRPVPSLGRIPSSIDAVLFQSASLPL